MRAAHPHAETGRRLAVIRGDLPPRNPAFITGRTNPLADLALTSQTARA